ncbi:hypothetical protein BC628DRAFT_421176 [Trametes gibbosa]|nr:hypothetical protein BC628DRAFT_421176 [Trametes gibbosa]
MSSRTRKWCAPRRHSLRRHHLKSHSLKPHPVIHHSLRPHPLKRNFPRSAFLKRRRLLSHLEPARRLWIHAANAARLVATFYANILDSRTKHPSPLHARTKVSRLCPSRCLADAAAFVSRSSSRSFPDWLMRLLAMVPTTKNQRTKTRSDYFHLPRSIIPRMLYRFLILLVPISSWAPSRRSITLLHMYSYSTPLMLCRTMSRFQHVFES